MSAIFRGLPRAAVRAAAPLSRSVAAATLTAASSSFAAAPLAVSASGSSLVRAAPVWVPRQHFVPPHGVGKIPQGDAESDPFPLLNNETASESEAGAGDGSEFFTEGDLAALGLGRKLPNDLHVQLRTIRRILPKHSVPSFAASFPVDIHPTLRAKVAAVADSFGSHDDFMLLLAAAARCRDVELCTKLIARAQAKEYKIKMTAVNHLIDTAMFHRDEGLLNLAGSLPIAQTLKGKQIMESAHVAFLQRSGKTEEAFRRYCTAVADGVLAKPWRSIYASTVPKLVRRVALHSPIYTAEQEEAALAAEAAGKDPAAAAAEVAAAVFRGGPVHCITLHERHPEANFAAWRYAMRALRGDMRLTFQGDDIRVPGNLVIDIATQGLRNDALETPGGDQVLRRRRNMILGFVRASGKQAAFSLRRTPSLFFIPRDAVEGVVTSERHLLPSERGEAPQHDSGLADIVMGAAVANALSGESAEAEVMRAEQEGELEQESEQVVEVDAGEEEEEDSD